MACPSSPNGSLSTTVCWQNPLSRKSCSVFPRKRSPLSAETRHKLLKKLRPSEDCIVVRGMDDAVAATSESVHEAADVEAMDLQESFEDPILEPQDPLTISSAFIDTEEVAPGTSQGIYQCMLYFLLVQYLHFIM